MNTPTTENFSLDKIKTLSQIEALDYLKNYFLPLQEGNHIFFNNQKFEIISKEAVQVYFKRMSKELNDFYFKQYTKICCITYKLNQPLFLGNNLINLCPSIKSKNDIYIEQYDRTSLDVFLNFVKEVLANNDKKMFDYLMSWLSNIVKGKKNDSCLYLKGEQGIGKSTFTEFLRDFVIGQDLSLETGSEPLKSKFNSDLVGKILVIFEELENFSTNEWNAVSSVLKRYITSPVYRIEAKHLNSYSTTNINNYIINSNNDAIKDDDGRRYVILDINHKYKGNHNYFGNLKSKCFNDETGRAFYSYLMSINTDNFIPQKFPETNSKNASCIKRLDNVYSFLKNEYILKKRNLNITTLQLYEEYCNYCVAHSFKKIDKSTFHKEKLHRIGIEYKKSNGNTKYNYSWTELNEIAKNKKWIDLELDEYKPDDAAENDDDENSFIEYLKKENEMLKLRIIELEKYAANKEENIDLVAEL